MSPIFVRVRQTVAYLHRPRLPMTPRRAIAWQAAATILMLLAASAILTRSSLPAQAFGSTFPGDVHQDFTSRALRGLGFSGSQANKIIKGIVRADVSGDNGYYTYPPAHMDDYTFTQARGWMTARWNAALDYVGSCSTQDFALEQLGLMLHTVQDFYSHSNFVEKGGVPPLGAQFRTTFGNVDSLNTQVTDAAGQFLRIKTESYVDLITHNQACCSYQLVGGGNGGTPTLELVCNQDRLRDEVTACFHADMNKDISAGLAASIGALIFAAPQSASYYDQAVADAMVETTKQWQLFESDVHQRYSSNADKIIRQLKHGCNDYDVVIAATQPSYQACTNAGFTINIYDSNGNPVDPDTSLVNSTNPGEYFRATLDGTRVDQNLQRIDVGVYRYNTAANPALYFRTAQSHLFLLDVWRKQFSTMGIPDKIVGGGDLLFDVKLPPQQYYQAQCSRIPKVWDPTQCQYVLPQPLPNITCKPDENQSVADLDLAMMPEYQAGSPIAPVAASPVVTSQVAILDNGYGFALAQLLNGLNISVDRLQPDFTPALAARYPVLFIPSGGLSGYADSSLMKARLAAYVAAGGTLIVMDQATGQDFSLLPGAGWRAYGFQEDFYCQFASVGIAAYAGMFASQRSSVLNLNIDGFFSAIPVGAQTLLRRTATGAPAMVLYAPGGGPGRVIATTAYADMATFMGQGTEDEHALLRDLVVWALRQDNVDAYGDSDAVATTLTITNTGNMTATSVSLSISGLLQHAYHAYGTVLAPGQATTLPFTATLDAGFPRGYQDVNALLFADNGSLITSQTAYRYALRTFDGAAQNWTYNGSPHVLVITSDNERYPYGATALFTFHLWNYTNAAAHYRVDWRVFQVGEFSQQITVPAGQEGTFLYQMPNLTKPVRLSASYYVQEGSEWRLLGSAERGIWTVSPDFSVQMVTAKSTYSTNETIPITVSVINRLNLPQTISGAVTVYNAARQALITRTLDITLAPNAVGQRTVTFAAPPWPVDSYSAEWRTHVADLPAGNFTVPFIVPLAALQVHATLPPGPAGSTPLTLTLANLSAVDAFSGTLALTMTNPVGLDVWSHTEGLSLAAGAQATQHFTMTLGALTFGAYSLHYSFLPSGQSRSLSGRILTLQNNLAGYLELTDATVRVRAPLHAALHLFNVGDFTVAPTVTFSLPLAGISVTQLSPSLAPGAVVTRSAALTLPATLDPGAASVAATLTLANSISRTAPIFLTPAAITAQLSGTTALAGQSFAVRLTNTGGIDASVNYSQTLRDRFGRMLVQTGTLSQTIEAGAAVTASLAVPASAVSGRYTLSTHGIISGTLDHFDQERTVTVDGVAAALQVLTQHPLYLTTDPVTTTAAITGNGAPLAGTDLDLQIVKATADVTNRWTTFLDTDGLPANDVRALTFSHDGLKWFGAVDWQAGPSAGRAGVLDDGGTPFNKADDIWQNFDASDGLLADEVHDLAIEGNGLIWFGNLGQFAGSNGGNRWPHHPDNRPLINIGGVSVLDDHGTPFDKTDDTWQTFNEADGLANYNVNAVAIQTISPTLAYKWFGVHYGGVSLLDDRGTPFNKADDTWVTFTPADGLTSNRVYAIRIDAAGRKWFGTQGGGVSLLDDNGTPLNKDDDTWTSFTGQDGLLADNVYAIAIDNAGLKWFGVASSGGTRPGSPLDADGLSVLDDHGTPFNKNDDTWQSFTTADGLAVGVVTGIAIDAHGRKWLATGAGGVSVLDDHGTPFDKTDDTWTTYTNADGLANEVVRAVGVDANGREWFGTVNGASVLGENEGEGLRLVWERHASVDLPGVTQVITSAGTLTDTGKYYLLGRLTTPLGQTVAQAVPYPFYVFPAQTALLLDSGPGPVRPSQPLTLSVTAQNDAALPLDNQTLTVTQDSAVIYAAGPFSVPAGGTTPFTVTAAAPAMPGLTRLAASMGSLSVSEDITVSAPLLQVGVDMPAVAGRDPFSLTVVLTNSGQIPADVTVAVAPQARPLRPTDGRAYHLAPGETVRAASSFQISQDTTFDIRLSGDLSQTLSVGVSEGQRASLAASVAPLNLAGQVDVAVQAANLGTLAYPFGAAFVINGQTVTRTYAPAPGAAISDTIGYVLPAGAYTLTYSSAAGSGSVPFVVRAPRLNQITAQIDAPNSVAAATPVSVTLTNEGDNDVSGHADVTTPWQSLSLPFALPAGAQTILTTTLSSDGAPGPGVYTATVQAVANGDVLADDSAAFSITPMHIRLGLPLGITATAGSTVTVGVDVTNDGGLTGLVAVGVDLIGLQNDTRTLALRPGETSHLDFAAAIPDDLGAVRGEGKVVAGDATGTFPVQIQGLTLALSGRSDLPAYHVGDMAVVTLHVTDTRNLPMPVPLQARVNAAGNLSNTQPFTLTGSASLIFTVPVMSRDTLVSFGIYQPSGRSLLLDTLRLRTINGVVYVYPERDVYLPGDTVLATVVSQLEGPLAVNAPGFVSTLDIVTGTQAFSFTLPPDLNAGSYQITYDLADYRNVASFEVQAVQANIVHADLIRSGLAAGAQLAIATNQPLPGATIAWEIQDPQGGTLGAWHLALDLPSGSSDVELPQHTFATSWTGTHRLVYTLRWQGRDMASGMLAFDVDGASLLGIAPARAVYRAGAAVTVLASTLGQGNATLSYAVDGVAVGQQVVSLPGGLGSFSTMLDGLLPGSHQITADLAQGGSHSAAAASVSVAPLPTVAIAPQTIPVSATEQLRIALRANEEGATTFYRWDAGDLLQYLDQALTLPNPRRHLLSAYARGADGAVGPVTAQRFATNACYTADANADDRIDALDIADVAGRWNNRVGDPQYSLLADMDLDGDIDIVDIELVAARWGQDCLCSLADFDGSGSITVADIEQLAAHWGFTPLDPAWDPRFDLDGNGAIAVADLVQAATHWGATCP